jgi:hypothetical protein
LTATPGSDKIEQSVLDIMNFSIINGQCTEAINMANTITIMPDDINDKLDFAADEKLIPFL